MASAQAEQADRAASNGRVAPEDRTDLGGGRPGVGEIVEMLTSEGAEGRARRWLPGRELLSLSGKLAARPHVIALRSAELAAEVVKAAVGRSDVEPDKGDKRFDEPAWEHHPVFRTLGKGYLATDRAVDRLIDDAGLDWHSERRVRFLTRNVLDALAPTNFPAANPKVLKATLDSGGKNLIGGTKRLFSDFSSPPFIPTKVDPDAFEVGEDLATTEGAVVYETELFELLEYQATTDEVREVPLLMVPPMINKYYIADLAPDRSMLEYFVGQGQQTFAISWRNPDEDQADWTLDTYVGGALEALDVIEEITSSTSTHLLALCAGGTVATMAVSHLAETGAQDRIAGLGLGVCVLDQERAGTAGAFMDRSTALMATAESARRGYVDGATLAGVFAWLRPNDLVWRYWVNSYLLDKDPPPFDVLYWNQDSTRMPAGLHADFMRLGLENALVTPGKAEALGTPVDLGAITVDAYVVAGIADHISPWEDCYRTTQLLGGDTRFVLSNSGHIVAMVNPPDNEKASFQLAEDNPPEASDWLERSGEQKGTWWEDWDAWLAERSGELRAAREQPGSGEHAPIRPAPGRYVLED